MTAPDTGTALQRLLAEDWQYRLEQDPEGATFLGDHQVRQQAERHLPPQLSRGARRTTATCWRARRRSSPATLKGQDRLSLQLFLWEKQVDVEGQQFATWLMPLDQLDGVQLAFPAADRGDAVPHRP